MDKKTSKLIIKNMLKIYTYSHRRPDFIKYQIHSIKKHIKDTNYEYVVFNNAIDDASLSSAIKNECSRLGVKCIDILLEQQYNRKQGEWQFVVERSSSRLARLLT